MPEHAVVVVHGVEGMRTLETHAWRCSLHNYYAQNTAVTFVTTDGRAPMPATMCGRDLRVGRRQAPTTYQCNDCEATCCMYACMCLPGAARASSAWRTAAQPYLGLRSQQRHQRGRHLLGPRLDGVVRPGAARGRHHVHAAQHDLHGGPRYTEAVAVQGGSRTVHTRCAHTAKHHEGAHVPRHACVLHEGGALVPVVQTPATNAVCLVMMWPTAPWAHGPLHMHTGAAPVK